MRRRIISILNLHLLMMGIVASHAPIPPFDQGWLGDRLVSAHWSALPTPPQRRRRRRRRSKAQPGKLIPKERVLEIQRALVKRGFLKKTSGKYDEATIKAMKAFQTSEELRLTGYPTARALKRLGLSPRPTSKPSEQPKEAEASNRLPSNKQ